MKRVLHIYRLAQLLAPPLLISCSSYSLPEMWIEKVSPNYIYNGEEAFVTIQGRNFIPLLKMDTRGGGVVVEGDFQILLFNDSDEINGIEAIFVDFSTITFLLAAGERTGVYDLKLTDPFNREAELSGAVEIVNVKADHMEVEFGLEEALVGSTVTAYLNLVDASGGGVSQARDVTLTLTGDHAVFGENSLQGEVEGNILMGRLEASGKGWVEITGSGVEEVTLCADAENDSEIQENVCDSIYFSPGEVSSFLISEIDSPQTAGLPFLLTITAVDEWGNRAEDFNGRVSILDFSFSVTPRVSSNFLNGMTEEMVTIFYTHEDDTIVVADLSGHTGVSNTFDVVSSELHSFAVDGPLGMVRAGDSFRVEIEAGDAYGNPVEDFDEVVTLSDLTGTLSPESAGGFSGGSISIDAVVTLALDDNVITAGYNGISGESSPFDVRGGAAASIEIGAVSSPQRAGNPFTLEMTALDSYGNISVDFEEYAGLSDLTGTLSPSSAGPFSGGELFVDVTVFQAMDEDRISAASESGLTGETAPFDVLAGLGDSYSISLPSTEVTAGEEFTLQASILDAWGNLSSYSGYATISDLTSTLTPNRIGPFTTGTASLNVTVTSAMEEDVITIRDPRGRSGESSPFTVMGGEPASLSVTLPGLVVEAGETFLLELAALDEYGNRAPGFEGGASITDLTGTLSPAVTGDFEEGEISVPVSISAVMEEDIITASSEDGLTGESETFPVYDFECGSPPSALLFIDGGEYGISCWEGAPMEFSFDTLSSEGGGGFAIERVILDFGDGDHHSSSSTFVVEHEYEGTGTWRAGLAVADGRLCASQSSGYIFAGENDGSPAGWIDLSPEPSTLYAGSGSPAPQATVTVTARDCSGDLSVSQPVTVQVDRGQVLEADEDEAEQGIQLYTESDGTLSFTISVEGEVHEGVLSMAAGGIEGNSLGLERIEVLNDTSPPVVVGFSPYGFFTEPSSLITVYFNEEILETTLNDGNISLTGSVSGSIALSEIFYSAGERRLELYPDSPLSEDEYHTVTLSSGIRDLAGNFLDHDFDGAATGSLDDFSFLFGNLEDSSPPYLTAFSSTHGLISPDGQDGEGEGEPDSETFVLEGCDESGVALVQLFIYDELEEAVRVLAAAGTSCDPLYMEWDGRDAEGMRVANGEYRIVPVIYDSAFNRFEGDEVYVGVENRIDFGEIRE